MLVIESHVLPPMLAKIKSLMAEHCNSYATKGNTENAVYQPQTVRQ